MTVAPPSAAPRLRWRIHLRGATAFRRLPIARRDMLLLITLGIAARAATAALLRHPGYIDAAYYYAVARNVASGRGLTEDFIITYLVPAHQVIHPSNLWWLPGASLLLVPFFWVFGSAWWVALLPNILLTGTLPILGYLLGQELLGTRRAALAAGLLTITSGFYYPLYDPMPDNFGLYAWTAGAALLLIMRGMGGKPRQFALAGALIGLANLARAEAPILLLVAAVVWWQTRRQPVRTPSAERFAGTNAITHYRSLPLPVWSLFALLGLYIVVMAPWFARNLLLVGAPLPPGGLQGAWLRTYDDFFSYGKTITPATYLAWGVAPILGSKLYTIGITLRQLAAVMDFVLAPFAALGLWRLRRDTRALPWLLYLIISYLGLTLVFTFPTLYGSVLHSAVAVFPFLNVAAVAGIEAALDWQGRRGGPDAMRRTAERKRVYLGLAVGLSAVLSAFLILANAHAWDATANAYARAGTVIAADSSHDHPTPLPSGRRASAGPIVMVADPANFFVDTGQRAIVLPDQGIPTMTAAARRYGARYLVLEPVHSPAQNALWSGTAHTPLLTLLYTSRDVQVYRWNW